jgi:hypothetical protein
MRETADINESNNSWNTMPEPSCFTIFNRQGGGRRPKPAQPDATGRRRKVSEKKEQEFTGKYWRPLV